MKALITGFAGSFGTAFTNYFLERGDRVTGVDNNEWAVASFSDHPNLIKKLADISEIEGEYDLTVHLAAYKHADLGESNSESFFHNNVDKTALLYANVKGPKLFISTDKAVEPVGRYGQSKLAAEKLTKALKHGVIARCGNILASSGSVIPKWEAAIERGEPLPITDPQMTRYMIPATLAVENIMALYPNAQPGQIIIPEMGKPMPLQELIDKFMDIKNIPTGYPVEIIGIRPGEKLHEKLRWDHEQIIYQDEYGEILS